VQKPQAASPEKHGSHSRFARARRRGIAPQLGVFEDTLIARDADPQATLAQRLGAIPRIRIRSHFELVRHTHRLATLERQFQVEAGWQRLDHAPVTLSALVRPAWQQEHVIQELVAAQRTAATSRLSLISVSPTSKTTACAISVHVIMLARIVGFCAPGATMSVDV
jgi:hypothetical protein